MNPWGWLLVILAALAIFIGIKGTQNSVYAFITGRNPNTGSTSGRFIPVVQAQIPTGFASATQSALQAGAAAAQQAAAAARKLAGG